MTSAQGLPRTAEKHQAKRASTKLSATSPRTLTLPKGKSDYTYFDRDVKGFGLRLRESGASNWIFYYKIGSKHRRMVLGSTSALSVADARKTAERLKARVKLGQDPATEKADAKIRAAETFKAKVDAYLAHQRVSLRPRSYPDVERHLLKHSKILHALPLASIARRNIASVISAVAKNSGLVTGNRVRTSLSGFYSWAMQQGLVENNPVIGTAQHKETSRDRVLTPTELRIIWQALGDDHFGSIIRLLALTGQRAGEIAGLRWSEVQDDVILLPGDRTKNHRAHVVPLSDAARAIIAKLEIREGRDMIFGRGEKQFSGWSNCKERLDALVVETTGAPLPHWTPHDLRRTFATYSGGGIPAHQLERLPPREKEMARGLDIEPHVIEGILNHVSGYKAGVAGTYQRGSYENKKRIALDRWAEHLMAIVEDRPSNITPIRRGV
jgi:integrase